MKKLILIISSLLILIFWPISFISANSHSWVPFFLALVILVVDWLLWSKKFKYHYYLYLLLPLIHPVYLIFPLVIFFMNLQKIGRFSLIVYIVLLIILTTFSWKTFYAYSIFTPDPLAQDTLIKKISLIPNRHLARVFENKTTVYQDKFKSNIFTSLDLNNYFFSLHPREIGDNQNLTKYSYLTLIPFLIGLFFLYDSPNKKWIVVVFIATVITVAFINNQDRFDILLYLPVSLICLHGLRKLLDIQAVLFWIFTLVFISISFIELLRVVSF